MKLGVEFGVGPAFQASLQIHHRNLCSAKQGQYPLVQSIARRRENDERKLELPLLLPLGHFPEDELRQRVDRLLSNLPGLAHQSAVDGKAETAPKKIVEIEPLGGPSKGIIQRVDVYVRRMEHQLVVADREVGLRTRAHCQQHAAQIVLNDADEKQAILAVAPGKQPYEVNEDLIDAVAADAEVQRVDARESLDF